MPAFPWSAPAERGTAVPRGDGALTRHGGTGFGLAFLRCHHHPKRRRARDRRPSLAAAVQKAIRPKDRLRTPEPEYLGQSLCFLTLVRTSASQSQTHRPLDAKNVQSPGHWWLATSAFSPLATDSGRARIRGRSRGGLLSDPLPQKTRESFLKAFIPLERGTNVEPEFCTPIRAFSPKAAWERWFKTKDDACQIPSLEGVKA